MSQQINLFNPLFLNQKKYFSARTMLQSLAVLVAGLVAISAYVLQQETMLERQAAASSRENVLQNERLASTPAAFPPGECQERAHARRPAAWAACELTL